MPVFSKLENTFCSQKNRERTTLSRMRTCATTVDTGLENIFCSAQDLECATRSHLRTGATCVGHGMENTFCSGDSAGSVAHTIARTHAVCRRAGCVCKLVQTRRGDEACKMGHGEFDGKMEEACRCVLCEYV